MSEKNLGGPVLICFDGSNDAASAIAAAGRLLGARPAVVVAVREPLEVWAPYDPATILDAGITKLASKSLDVDAIADDVAQCRLDKGLELARAAGFPAQERIARGTPWRAICDLADELDAAVIVLGARGLSRVRSALLGSVSAAVSVHAGRPVLIVHADGARLGAPDPGHPAGA
jgi:nucleotide-binding universal stress UspA family protein